MGFSRKQYFTHCHSSGGIKHILRDHTGKASWNFVPGFLQNSLYVLFPFDNIALYPLL